MADSYKQNPNLSDAQKRVLFERGTETPGTGEYLNHNEDGAYTCVNCGAELFSSDAKYESTIPGLIGWPSFSDMSKSGAVELRDDNSMFTKRTEAVCANCGGHLGHLFSDDSSPNGQHYCINSLSLGFTPKKKSQ